MAVHELLRRRAAMAAVVVRDRGAGLAPAVEREHERVHHEREHGGEHGDERREGELRPGPPRQAGRGEVVEGVREHVHVARAEDDPRREGLDDGEEVAVGAERRHGAGGERQAHAEHAGEEDRRDGDQLQPQRPGDAVASPARVRAAAAAHAVGRRCRRFGLGLRSGRDGQRGGREHEESEDEHYCYSWCL